MSMYRPANTRYIMFVLVLSQAKHKDTNRHIIQ